MAQLSEALRTIADWLKGYAETGVELAPLAVEAMAATIEQAAEDAEAIEKEVDDLISVMVAAADLDAEALSEETSDLPDVTVGLVDLGFAAPDGAAGTVVAFPMAPRRTAFVRPNDGGDVA